MRKQRMNNTDQIVLNFKPGFVVEERYEIVSNPVRRSLGIVYKAFDRETNTNKSLLFVPEIILNDPEAVENLIEESNLIRWLDHPNIARLYEFKYEGEFAFFDMEFVPGSNLKSKKIANPDKCFSENITKWIGVHVLNALEYAHDQNMIHRDLKPQNIMITPNGKIKLIDFGISEVVREAMSMVKDTTPATIILYMSPEQLRGKRVGVQSDIYSVGANLYDLVSGKPPFFSGDVYTQILREQPAILEHVSPALNRIFQKSLAKDSSERYANCSEMKTALELSGIHTPKMFRPAEMEKNIEAQKKEKQKTEHKWKFTIPPGFNNPTIKYAGISLVFIFLMAYITVKFGFYTNDKAGVAVNEPAKTGIDKNFNRKLEKALLEQAEIKFNRKLYFEPAGNNALELYREVLKINSANTIAVEKIDTIRTNLLAELENSYRAGNIVATDNLIEKALQFFPADSQFIGLKANPALYFNAAQQAAPVKLAILNGAGVKGIAARMASQVKDMGFDVVYVDNYRINGLLIWNLEKTFFNGIKDPSARINNLEKALGINYQKVNSVNTPSEATIQIVLGKDYLQLPAYK